MWPARRSAAARPLSKVERMMMARRRFGGPSITGDLHPQCIAILIEKQSGIDREILGYQDTQQVQVSQQKSVQQR